MSFLHDYLEHATSNEAPYMFHVWCGYSCLAAATSRRTWMTLDDSAIYPNLFILLVGNAGNGKTWSLIKAKKIIAELNLPYSGSKETPEGMLRFMAGDPNREKPILPYGGADHKLFLEWPDGQKREVHPYNIIASEFVDFIKSDDMGWINLLNNIYDDDRYQYRTKNMGDDILWGPYINLLGGLTTQVSASMQKDQIINTGLARRTIFQYGERRWDDPHSDPQLTPAQAAARERAMDQLRKIKTVTGKFERTPEAKEWWHKWYCENLASVPERHPSVQSWFASKSTQLMKLAMLTSLSERLDRVLEVSHFELPLAYLDELEKDLYKIFGGVGRNELADVSLKIFNYVSLLPEPISFRSIKVRFFRDLPCRRDGDKELSDCLGFLVGDGKLVQYGLGVALLQDFIYATPETMTAFVARSGVKPASQPLEVHSSLLQAATPATDPSTLPTSTPPACPPEAPTSPPPSPGTSISPLPMLVRE